MSDGIREATSNVSVARLRLLFEQKSGNLGNAHKTQYPTSSSTETQHTQEKGMETLSSSSSCAASSDTKVSASHIEKTKKEVQIASTSTAYAASSTQVLRHKKRQHQPSVRSERNEIVKNKDLNNQEKLAQLRLLRDKVGEKLSKGKGKQGSGDYLQSEIEKIEAAIGKLEGTQKTESSTRATRHAIRDSHDNPEEKIAKLEELVQQTEAKLANHKYNEKGTLFYQSQIAKMRNEIALLQKAILQDSKIPEIVDYRGNKEHSMEEEVQQKVYDQVPQSIIEPIRSAAASSIMPKSTFVEKPINYVEKISSEIEDFSLSLTFLKGKSPKEKETAQIIHNQVLVNMMSPTLVKIDDLIVAFKPYIEDSSGKSKEFIQESLQFLGEIRSLAQEMHKKEKDVQLKEELDWSLFYLSNLMKQLRTNLVNF